MKDENPTTDGAAYSGQSSGQEAVGGDSQVGLRLTRREVLVGGAAVTALSTGVLRAADLPAVWSIGLEPDPGLQGRSIISVRFGGQLLRSFRENAFGERARAQVTQIPLRQKGEFPPEIRDLRLTIRGMELARSGLRPEFFELAFEFRHDGVGIDPKDKNNFIIAKSNVEIFARGWIFGPDRVELQRSLSRDDWKTDKPVDLVKAARFANLLREAIFGKRLMSPPDGLKLSMTLPSVSGKTQRLLWHLAATSNKATPATGLTVSTHPANGKLAASRSQDARLLWATGVDIWRELPTTAAVPEAKSPETSRSIAEFGDEHEKVVRTVGELRGVVTDGTERRAILAEHALTNGQVCSVALHKYRCTEGSVVRLTRVDRSADLDLEIATVAEIAGDLLVVTTRTNKVAARSEGPFRISAGRMRLSGPPDASTLGLQARFALDDKPVDITTAHGPLILSSPEEKSAATGRQTSAAPARLGALDWRLDTFELTARVHSAAVSVSDFSGGKTTDVTPDYRVDLSFPSGAEVLFRLHGLADEAATRPSIGRVSLGWLQGAKDAENAFGTRYSLPLEGAELKVLRWRDLAHMTFRFVGLDLRHEDRKVVLRPRGLARVQDVQDRQRVSTVQDSRPIMVVELPPQHVAEEAFFERREIRPTLPAYPLAALDMPKGAEARDLFDRLRSAYGRGVGQMASAKQRLEWRESLNKLIDDLPEPAKTLSGNFREFRDAFEKKAKTFATDGSDRRFRLPKEQWQYVGPEFLDPAARFLAEWVSSEVIPLPDAENLFDELPEDPVGMLELAALVENARQRLPGRSPKELDAEAEGRAQPLRERRDPFYAAFKLDYDKAAKAGGGGALVRRNEPLQTYLGRTRLREALDRLRTSDPLDKREFGEFRQFALAMAKRALKKLGLDGDETPRKIARARLSGTSRLVFRLNTDDHERPGGAIPFTLDELMNWSRHELAVVRRAEKTLKTYKDGSRRHAWDRVEETDLEKQLLHQGFTQGGWAQEPDKGLVARAWPQAVVTVEQRLAEVASFAGLPPSPLQTSIELPFRLHLSPAQDGRFRTRHDVPPWIWSRDERAGDTAAKADVASDGQVSPLWTAELETGPGTALRAIWSPDFRPEAFVREVPGVMADHVRRPAPARRNRPPMRGPYAPWAMGRDLSNASSPGSEFPPKFRTSLDAFDRHELVTLTSLHGLPVIGRVKPESGSRIGIDQREPPPGFQVAISGWPLKAALASDGATAPWLLNDVYVPRPLDPEGLELALSSLGGFLRVNSSFEPPASVLDGLGDPYFDALSIERWRHRIVLGRDISAEVVYKGYLFPLAVRCSLIKVTERRFQPVKGRLGPVAVLRQHMFLQVGKPEKSFPAFRQADDGRRVPFTGVKLITTVTPDIVDPYDRDGKPESDGIYASGLIDLGEARGGAFWPRTARRRGSEVKFDILLDGRVPTRLPLIFVDNAAANDRDAMKRLCEHYNQLGELKAAAASLSLVTADIHGAKLTFAPEREAGDTQLETLSITVAAEGRRPASTEPVVTTYNPIATNTDHASDAFMQGADQPPFYPAMRRARVKLAQAERLTTQSVAPVDVAYDTAYAVHGFDKDDNKDSQKEIKNPNEVFLSVLYGAPKLTFGKAGDRGGAVGRPELDIKGISRTLGTIGATSIDLPKTLADASDVPKAVGYVPPADRDKRQKAAEFFNDDAKLLGLVKLKDIITALLGTFEPKLREITEFAGGLAGDTDKLVRENVLLPISGLLDRLDRRLRDIQFNKEDGKKALRRIYPDVLTTMEALLAAVGEALKAPSASGDASAALGAYTRVFTTGRSFVSALDRVVRDPVTPLREAGRKVFDDASRTLVADFEAAIGKHLGPLRQVIDPLKLRGAACDLLREQVFKPLKGAIFALPLPSPDPIFKFDAASEPGVAKALSDAMDAALDDANREAGEPETWPGARALDKPLFDEKAYWSRVAGRLGKESGPLQARLRAEAAAIEAASKALAGAVEEETRRAEAKLRGYVWSRIFALLDRIDRSTKGLQKDGLDGLVKVLEGLEGVGQLIGAAQSDLLALAEVGRAFSRDALFLCSNVLGAIDDCLHMMLPIDAVEDLATCVPTKNCAIWDKSSVGPFALAFALIRFARGVREVAANETGKLAVLARRLRETGKTKQLALAGTVDAVREALVELNRNLPNPESEFVAAILDLNQAVAGYREFSKSIADACQKLTDLPSAMSIALRSLRQINDDRLKVVKMVRDVAGPLHAFIGSAGTFDIKLDPPPGSGNGAIAAKPFDDPHTWTWSNVSLSNEDDASQAVDAARKDVLGLVLPILQASVDMLGATSSAGAPLAPPPGGLPPPLSAPAAARGRRRNELRVKLNALRSAVGGQATKIRAWLDSAHAALDSKPADAYLAKIAQDLGKLAAELSGQVDSLVAVLEDRDKDLSDAKKAIEELRVALSADGGLPRIAQAIAERVIGLAEHDAAQIADGFQAEKEAFERRLLGFLAQAGSRLDEAYRQAIMALIGSKIVTGALTSIAEGFDASLQTRGEVDKKVDKLLEGLPAAIGASVGKRLKASLYAYTPIPDPLPVPPDDGLAKQTGLLKESARVLKAEASTDAQKLAAAEKALELFRSWDAAVRPGYDQADRDGKGPIAPLFIVRNLARTLEDLLKEVLRGNVVSIIDFGAVKQEIERELKQLIPARLTLAYDLDTKISKLPPIFEPNDDTRLTLKARTVINLLEGGSPKVSSSGELGPFKLRLVGKEYDIVTLSFDGARFGSETGGKFKTNIVGVELGKMVEFLQQVSSFLSFSSNGFYIRALFDPPGIEAGYLMPPMGFAIGALGISNIALTASCVLPFDGTEAMMKVGVSTPETPFLINVGVYGGGGHLALYAGPGGILGFEASFEFGAVVQFQLGPLRGMGRVTTGIFLRTFKKGQQTLSTIEGLVSAGGQASLAMFRFAALLQIRVGQQPGGDCDGTAIFTFSFSLGIRDITFRIVGRKKWGKGFNGNPNIAWNDLPGGAPRTMLASNGTDTELAQLVAGGKQGPDKPEGPRLVSLAVCKGDNYRIYRSYFSETRPWRPQVW